METNQTRVRVTGRKKRVPSKTYVENIYIRALKLSEIMDLQKGLQGLNDIEDSNENAAAQVAVFDLACCDEEGRSFHLDDLEDILTDNEASDKILRAIIDRYGSSEAKKIFDESRK